MFASFECSWSHYLLVTGSASSLWHLYQWVTWQLDNIYISPQKSFILRKVQNVNADTAPLLHECLECVDTTYRWMADRLSKQRGLGKIQDIS